MTEHTIFNNTSAFGLMPDHLRDELRAHHAAGRKVEWFRGDNWQEIRPTWSSDAIYRAIPARSYDDVDLLFDAYKAILVLHKSLDTYGLTLGAQVARELADRIVKAHPEFPPRTALRAAVAAIDVQPDPRDAQIARLVEAASEQLAYMDMCGDKGDLERNLRAALAAVKGGDA